MLNEFRSYFRYAIPGALSVLLYFLALVIGGDSIIGMLRLQKVTGLLGWTVSAFVSSGALGYIYANVYMAIYWFYAREHLLGQSTKEMLIALAGKNLLRIEGVEAENLETKDAWLVATQIWYHDISPKHKEYQQHHEWYNHLVHSLGAAIVGTLVAALAWTITKLNMHTLFVAHSDTFVLAGWPMFVWALCRCYRMTLSSWATMSNNMIRQYYEDSFDNVFAPRTIMYYRSDLTGRPNRGG